MREFDEAMISRIHLALKYEPLKQVARKAVWEFFLDQAAMKAGSPDYSDALDDMAEKRLNGREVRCSTRERMITDLAEDTKCGFIARPMAE